VFPLDEAVVRQKPPVLGIGYLVAASISIRVELNGIFLKKNGEFRRLPPDRTTSRPLCRQASVKHLKNGNLASVLRQANTLTHEVGLLRNEANSLTNEANLLTNEANSLTTEASSLATEADLLKNGSKLPDFPKKLYRKPSKLTGPGSEFCFTCKRSRFIW